MEVTSSTTATSSLFGQEFNGEDEDQNLPLSSNPTGAEAASSTPLELEGDETGFEGASSSDVEPTLQYGPVVCPGFYSQETSLTSYGKDLRDSRAVHGSCGLYNLGNTCFMNSGLQSLISCSPLVKHFSERFTLNESNHNTLTGHFYILLCKMWCGQFSIIHPKRFKEFLGLYHSQFEDYRQHDCQEFLAFLLDTLHEQLNESIQPNNYSCSVSLPCVDVARSSDFTDTNSVALNSAFPSSPGLVSCSETELNKHNDFQNDTCKMVDNFNHKLSENHERKHLADSCSIESSTNFPYTCKKLDVNIYTSLKSPDNNEAAAATSCIGDKSSPKVSASCEGMGVLKQNDDEDDSGFISSSGCNLKRYTSQSNLDNVSSSDVGFLMKPSLKRVSTDTGAMASGLTFSSEDSNQSSISVHSTDSEQSSTFKRLKIESLDASRSNSNSNNNSSMSLKDFAVTSSSDCKMENQGLKQELGMNIGTSGVKKADNSGIVSSNLSPVVNTPNKGLYSTIVHGDMSCHEDAMESTSPEKANEQLKHLQKLEDFYKKETKTLNTNVLVSEVDMPEVSCDSEKFAKVDNRQRHTSRDREINLLQEVFDEEDKVDKVLIGEQFALKDNNLHAQPSSSTFKTDKSSTFNIMLNNTYEGDHAMSCEALSKLDVASTSKMSNDVAAGLSKSKVDEAEKNIQMQAYSKFNTTPPKSNIRIDLSGNQAIAKADNIDEADYDSSEDEEIDKTLHTSRVEDCSSIPNCLRNFLPSEVAMANQAWQEYKSRNNSVIVSTFQGQFRSTVVCSECSHVSVTYEPFMYLSLPIPHAMEQQLSVTFISPCKPPVRYLLDLLKTDKISAAKKKLKEMIGLSGDVIMAEVLDSHVSRILDDNILLKYVNTFNRKMYAFEIVTALSRARNGVEDNILLNNENSREESIMREDLCLVSTSKAEVNMDLLPYQTDSQLSNQSLDSIQVNTPSSRDTMDLGFSDSEMCDDEVSVSSPPQRLHLSSSYFQETGTGRRGGDDDDNDLCQSTTSDTLKCNSPVMYKGFTSSSLSANGQCLSWQIVRETDVDDCDETASTVTTVVGSSSSVSGDDCIAPCSSTRFWVDLPVTQKSLKDESLVLLSIENSTIEDDDDINNDCDNAESCVSNHEGDDDNEASPLCDNVSVKKVTTVAGPVISSSNSCNPDCGDEDDRSHHDCNEVKMDSGIGMRVADINRSHNTEINDDASSPENPLLHKKSDVQMSDQNQPGTMDESPGSYFMQSPHLHTMDSVCHGASFGGGDELSITEEAEVKCLTDNWTRFDSMEQNVDPLSTPSLSLTCPDAAVRKVEEPAAPGPSCDEWRSCAICLEDLPISQLLTHVSCDGVFCQSCLDMSVKHTADVSFFCCPICLQPANVCEDFVPVPTTEMAKLQARILTICMAYRHMVIDNTGTSSLQLVGHPNVIQMPSVMTGDNLYAVVDKVMGRPHLTYSVLLTDGQGLNCSRCPYSAHCLGCEIAREGEIILRPSDNLTVHSCEMLPPEDVLEMQFIYDDASMASLRSSEPTTLMDCFGAFTQSELLDENNPWYCPTCERNQCAKKTMTVWRYPDNLIIHLKRFVYQDLSSNKVDSKVVFPVRGMDVRGFLSGPSSPDHVYDLYSVICHFGGASCGHYTSYALHPLTNQWYYYNDETVSLQAPSDNEFISGYVLFYQRQGTAVDFIPPQFLPSMEESLSLASSTTTTTFHHQDTTTNIINTTTTDQQQKHQSTTSSSSNNNNERALVLFVPPSSTISSSSLSTMHPSTNKPLQSMSVDDNVQNRNYNCNDIINNEEDDDDDDDYDCERRCSPSSDYGSLSVHFGSVLPDPDHIIEDSGGDEILNPTDYEASRSPSSAEPDSTFLTSFGDEATYRI